MKSVCDSVLGLALEVIETPGSVDNVIKLASGEIDLAIVQNDIAFFAENGLDPFDIKINGLRGIMTFYLEPIFVITNDPSFIIWISWRTMK